MWKILTGAISGIFTGWVDLKKAKYKAEESRYLAAQKAESDWDTKALDQAQYSWKDELITLVIFEPQVVAWFDKERAMSWVQFVTELPVWYQVIIAVIVCASFGLRWFFKNKFANGFKA